MSAEEKEIIRNITAAAAILPDAKREYILGYAEGVIAGYAEGVITTAERVRDAECNAVDKDSA